MITGIAHVNLLVPPGTLDQAEAFYAGTLGMTPVAVPVLQKDTLAWFDITPNGQQVHIAFGTNENQKSTRHPCFKLESPEALLKLQSRIWEHFDSSEVKGKPMEADKPGERDSGAQGVEYPKRFFARDYAGNRLEFSV
ncbi:hypothetical protein BGZ60DRAFT_414307 [Tricladium varicosporioides]|nr:hypothetical protein BGZ60DRAFT_414307 [Hymenoscyphus varicosporioides]